MRPTLLHLGLCVLLTGCQGCVDEARPIPTVRIPKAANAPERASAPITERVIRSPEQECLARGRAVRLQPFAASFPTLDLESGVFFGTDLSILAVNEWDVDDPLRVGRIIGRLRIIRPSVTVQKLLRELRILNWTLKSDRLFSSQIVFLIGARGPQFAPMPEEGTLDDVLPYPRADEGAADEGLPTLRELASYPVLKRTPLLRNVADTIVAEGRASELPEKYTGMVTLIVTAVELWRDGENLGCAPRDE